MNRFLRKRLVYPIFIGIFVSVGFIPTVYGETPLVSMVVVQPRTIQINSFFSGTKITVRTEVPSGDEAVLRLIGPKENLELMRKDRVKGLWMNAEQIQFQDIPNVYLLWTSEKMSSGDAKYSLSAMKLDYFSLLSESLPNQNQEKKSMLVGELIKLKESDKLFQIHQGAVRIKPLKKGGWDQVDAVLDVPAKIFPGVYALELITVKDGKGTLLHSSAVEVKLAGFPALISKLAFQNGLWYGILAVIIATFGGLLIGVIFSSKQSH